MSCCVFCSHIYLVISPIYHQTISYQSSKKHFIPSPNLCLTSPSSGQFCSSVSWCFWFNAPESVSVLSWKNQGKRQNCWKEEACCMRFLSVLSSRWQIGIICCTFPLLHLFSIQNGILLSTYAFIMYCTDMDYVRTTMFLVYFVTVLTLCSTIDIHISL